MPAQHAHAALVDPTHDEQSRQNYYMAIRRYLASRVAPGDKAIYHAQVNPTFVKKHGREPNERHEVRKVMTRNDYYQMYAAMQRHTQEMTWDSVIDSVERGPTAIDGECEIGQRKNRRHFDFRSGF